MLFSKNCFNCKKKMRGEEDTFGIAMNTLEGKHTVEVCATCAKQFDEILEQVENIKNERLNAI